MKRSVHWLFLISVIFFPLDSKLISQNFFDGINMVQSGLHKYIDTLDLIREKFNEGKIGSVEYQLEINRISTEISMLAGRNMELTFPVVDSISSIVIAESEKNTMGTFDSIENDTVEEFSVPKAHKKAKHNLLSTLLNVAMPPTHKKTYIEGNIRVGFIQSLGPNGAGTYTPSSKAIHNFYLDNFHVALRTRMGQKASRLFVRYGLGLDYVSIKQKMNIQPLITDQVLIPYFDSKTSTDLSIEATKLRLKYLYIPLGVTCQIQKNLSVEASLFVNILLRERYFTEFKVNERDYETVLYNNLGPRNCYAGLNAQIFYKRTGLFFETSVNSIFKKQSFTNLNYFKFGFVFK